MSQLSDTPKEARLKIIKSRMTPWVDRYAWGNRDNMSNFLNYFFDCIFTLKRAFDSEEFVDVVTPMFHKKFPDSDKLMTDNMIEEYAILAEHISEFLAIDNYMEK